MASRRITVSTVGVAKMIKKMADDNPKFNLAVSLHAALNETRSSIMPINDTNSLEELAEALQYWYQKTKSKVTYEYVVWKGVNDSPEHAQGNGGNRKDNIAQRIKHGQQANYGIDCWGSEDD